MQTNWRVLAGLLLALPLVMLWGKMRLGLQESALGARRISPVLSPEERRRLITYGHDCGLSSECEPPLGCLTETRARKQYCTDSQCTTHMQCPEGQLCQSIATTGKGPLVRVCAPTGVRQEGERCIKLPEAKESACAPEWVCAGIQGWCARPCDIKGSAECPEGSFCADTLPWPACLPTCESRGCPTGLHCIRFEEGASACAEIYGVNCQQAPCAGGRQCQVEHDPMRSGKVWMECVERCSEVGATCGAGFICDGWQCKPACEPQEPIACGAGYRCMQRRPDRPWVCQPDYW